MNKDNFPIDENGNLLAIGDYVKYENKVWEIVDYEDSEQPCANEDYTEHSTLLLSPRSKDGENIWVEDYDVSLTKHKQLYFEL